MLLFMLDIARYYQITFYAGITAVVLMLCSLWRFQCVMVGRMHFLYCSAPLFFVVVFFVVRKIVIR